MMINSKLRLLTILSLVLTSFGTMCVAQFQDKHRPPFIVLVPTWHGPDTNQAPISSGQYIYYDENTMGLVIAYPSSLRGGSTSDIVIRHIDRHTFAILSVKWTIKPLDNGMYEYQYDMHNSKFSAGSLEQFVLYVDSKDTSISGNHSRWVTQKDEEHRANNYLRGGREDIRIGWVAPTSKLLEKNENEGGFKLRSIYRPGFVHTAARSHGNNELSGSDIEALPSVVKEQLDQNLTSAMDESISIAIGPCFEPNAPLRDRITNFKFGIQRLISTRDLDPRSKFVVATSDYLEAISTIDSAVLAQSRFELSTYLPLATTDTERSIAIAASITFKE